MVNIIFIVLKNISFEVAQTRGHSELSDGTFLKGGHGDWDAI